MKPIQYQSNSVASDTELRNRVVAAFARLQLPLTRLVDVRVLQGVIQLRGQVRSFYEKQLAFALAQRVPGVQGVVDQVTVIYPVGPNLVLSPRTLLHRRRQNAWPAASPAASATG